MRLVQWPVQADVQGAENLSVLKLIPLSGPEVLADSDYLSLSRYLSFLVFT